MEARLSKASEQLSMHTCRQMALTCESIKNLITKQGNLSMTDFYYLSISIIKVISRKLLDYL